MKPKNPEGSVAQRAIALIREHGSARSSWLGERLGIPGKLVSSSLHHYVANGTLVTCQVTIENGQRRCENEYRLSATGPMNKSMRDYDTARARATLARGREPVRRATIDAPSRLQLDAAAALERAA